MGIITSVWLNKLFNWANKCINVVMVNFLRWNFEGLSITFRFFVVKITLFVWITRRTCIFGIVRRAFRPVNNTRLYLPTCTKICTYSIISICDIWWQEVIFCENVVMPVQISGTRNVLSIFVLEMGMEKHYNFVDCQCLTWVILHHIITYRVVTTPKWPIHNLSRGGNLLEVCEGTLNNKFFISNIKTNK